MKYILYSILYYVKFYTVNPGWSIYTMRKSLVMSSKNIVFVSLKNAFRLVNSADPDEMPHSVAFHLGIHCLQKYRF